MSIVRKNSLIEIWYCNVWMLRCYMNLHSGVGRLMSGAMMNNGRALQLFPL
ncbi:hypothetical protein KsCSTR_02800 [Candidatus Kuenenia stuttgartiensis]|uniref:Uncharacterized protein n=1 Tax=Kuenenia stuttgartiensis TaxID=174633 RepID=Q1PY33_KUEST|nr:hypothetical protein KsCSTR_02800 [Candidatus Kuenenia stuttgartiensis]CAJ72951.1 unknown protein [Candidatus Kuenenia stuttgartiensis]